MDEERIARLRAGPTPPKTAQSIVRAHSDILYDQPTDPAVGADEWHAVRQLSLADLPAELIDQLRRVRQDIIAEAKQEGPWRIGRDADSMEFQIVAGHTVLLPADAALNVERCMISADRQSITVFGRGTALGVEMDGWIMVCDRWPGEDWYVPILWHIWMPAAAALAEQLADARMVRFTLEPANPPETDRTAFDALSDEDLEQAALAELIADARHRGIDARAMLLARAEQIGDVAGLNEVLQALAGCDAWMQLSFLLEPKAALADEAPIAILWRGEVEAVLAAARVFGEHGAT